jgi:uncharacterized membrane protein AbrB (regulator of aidB expression)
LFASEAIEFGPDPHARNVRLVVMFDGLIVLFVVIGGLVLAALRLPAPNWLGNLAATALGSMGTLLTFTFTGVVPDRRAGGERRTL